MRKQLNLNNNLSHFKNQKSHILSVIIEDSGVLSRTTVCQISIRLIASSNSDKNLIKNSGQNYSIIGYKNSSIIINEPLNQNIIFNSNITFNPNLKIIQINASNVVEWKIEKNSNFFKLK